MRPAIEVFVEDLAMALCAASGEQWRTNEGLSAWAVVNLNPDSLNNHWRYKARALLPVIEADRLAVVAEIVAELRSGDRGYWTWRDKAADHIEAKFGGGSHDAG